MTGKMSVWRVNLILTVMLCVTILIPQSFAADRSEIEKSIDEVLADPSLKNTLVGIYAISLKDESVLYAHNADIAMIPASNNKLFTTAAALDLLGPDYTYTTTLERVGEVKNGILKGHLVIVGSGDPTISGRYTDGDITKILRDWIDEVKAKGIKRVEGFVVGDDDIWNDDDYAGSWDWSYVGEWYGAPSSALSLNDNCIDLHWTAGEKVGKPATYTLDPDTRYLTFQNFVTTRKKGSGSDRYYRRPMHSRTAKIYGGVDEGVKNVADYASVDNPTRFFATVFCELLEKAGIEVVEGPADIDDFEDKSVFQQGRREIVSYKSPPISELIRVVNKRSQNFFAEQLIRTLGQEKGREGGYNAGCRVVTHFLRKHDIETGGFNMEDGSGLAWSNRTSPKTLVELLQFMNSHRKGEIYRDSLPIGGGRDGSLRYRFNENEKQKSVAGKILGKTGSIFTTRTLSGYLTTNSGEPVAYSIMLNNDTNSKSLKLIDRIATLLVTEGK